MSWWGALDEFALLVFWLVVPGLALLWAMRVRGLVPVLVAPAISVGGLAAWAIVYGVVGIPWNSLTALLAVVVTAATALGARILAGRVRGTARVRHAHPQADHNAADAVIRHRANIYAAAGVLIGGLIAAIPVMRGMTGPDVVPEAGDTVFHLNAVRYILDVGDASTFLLGRMTDPLASQAFYPAGWHGLVALGTTGSVVVASNTMVVLLAGLVFPAALAAVALAASPRRPGVALFAPIAGAGFVNFPAQLFSWGALWPNALAFALVPAGLACTVLFLRAPAPGRRVAWAIGAAAAAGGVVLTQPNGILTYALVTTPLVVCSALGATIRGFSSTRGTRRVARVTLPLLAAAAWCAIWLNILHMMNDQLRTLVRTWYSGFWSGAWQALTDTVPHTTDTAPAIAEMIVFPGSRLIGLLAIVGVVCLLFRRESRWLIGSLAMVVVFAGLSDHPQWFTWTDAWFSDIYRLRAAVPLMSALVIAHALDAAAVGLSAVAGRVLRPMAVRHNAALRGAAALLVVVAFALVAGGLRFADREAVLRNRYVDLAVEGRGARTTPAEQAMIARLPGELSGGGVVLGNPVNGSPLVSAIADVPVVFPLSEGRWAPDARLVAERFDQIHADPQVCEALNRLGVRYFYADADVAAPDGRGQGLFAGIPADAPQPGFELIDAGGTARVYRITACD